jgi:SH3-like domain-containing protein
MRVSFVTARIRRRPRGALLGALALLVVSSAVWAGAKMVSVQVRETRARGGPSFLARVVADLAYGDRLAVKEEKGDWTHVQLPSGEGWVHSSALTDKKVVLSSGAKDRAAATSADEVALAGKGFSAEVEKEYLSKHKELDMAWVDRMEKLRPTGEQLASFSREGELCPLGGKP